MKKLSILIIMLLYAAVANGQLLNYVPNRMIVTPASSSLNSPCVDCDPFVIVDDDGSRLGDGVVHLRFNDVSIDTTTNKITFKVQMRKTLESQRFLTQGRVRMEYNSDAFGVNLDDPKLVLTVPNMRSEPGPSGQCSYEEGDFFLDKEINLSFPNPFDPFNPITINTFYVLSSSGGDTSLAFLERNIRSVTVGEASNTFGELTPDWVDFITLTCDVVDSRQDAEIAFLADLPQFSLADYGRNDAPPFATKRGFILADNDLRGFRLDGKTWAKDYSRYGNGEGVRLEFSKKIATQLTEVHFTLDSTDDNSLISTVTHVVNTPYVEIDFTEAIADDVLRLVSTQTNIVRDEEGKTLADGNFVASLIYNSEAPSVDTRPMRNGNEYTLTFSRSISGVTVNRDGSGLCVTEEDGICITTPTVPILRVTTHGTMPTTLTIVVDQSAGAKTGGVRSIEFMRNAILGTDAAVVEDYQPVLRDAIILRDETGPEIAVNRARSRTDGRQATGNLVPSGGNYVMYFRVTADEDVATLGNTNSYELQDNTGTVISDATPGTPNIVMANREVILQYTVPVSSNRADVTHFRLARRGSTSLQDGGDNNPIRDNDDPSGTMIGAGDVITDDASARATRNTDGSTITVSSVPAVSANDGLSYTLNYSVEVTSGGPVDGIGNFNFYTLSSNGRTVTPDMSRVTSTDDGSGTDATFVYTVTYASSQYDDVRAITGWTLTPTLNQLVNSDGNSATVSSNQPATRDMRSPVITVVDSPAPTLASNQFTVTFTVTADEPVATLNDPTSYALYRFEGATRSLVSGASPMPTSGSNNERTTLTYVVTTLTGQQVADTTSFALYRASGNKLLDASGNLPLRSRSPDVVISDTGAVSSEITPAERADTVTDSTNVTVAVASGATPAAANGNEYTMSFTVTNNDHATRPIDDLATPGSYKILREDVNDERVTSLTIVDSSGSATGGVATLEFTVRMPNQAVTEATEGFKLERADSSTALLDDTFSRPPTISGDTVADRDTTRPNMTVVPDDSPTANGVVYSFEFEVTASETVRTSNGAVNGLGDANSYVLLVAENQAAVAGGGTPSTRYRPTVVFDSAIPTQATVRFSGVDASMLQSDLSIGFPYGLMLGRANNGLRDLANNDPVQTSADGTRPNNLEANEVGNNEPLQADQVVLLDRVAPQITVATGSNNLTPNSSDQYVMQFTVTANEPVRNIADTNSYQLIRVNADESSEVLSPAIGSATVVRGTHDERNGLGQSSVFTYTVTFAGSGTTRLTNIRETKGFTLALVSGANRINLQDVATNLPAKSDGTAIYNTDNPPALINNGLIPTISGGVIDTGAVATIEKARPVITITKTDAVADANDLYTMTFTVTSSEPVPDIADRRSYVVRRVRDNNTFQSAGDLMNEERASIETNSMNTSATITLRRDLSTVSGGAPEIMITRGFTLLRANNSLIDRSGNLPVKTPGTPPLTDIANDAPIGPVSSGRVADSAVALRERIVPVITVNADPDQATVAANVRRYMGAFEVTSNDADPIRNINVPDAYQLMRVPMTGNPVAFTGANTLAFSGGRITFDATFSDTATDRTLIRNTRGFTLARNATADGDDLTDNARNPAVAAGAVLDTSAMAVATIDKTPARFSVAAGGMANPASDNGNQYGPMTFTVTSTEVILGIGNSNSYAVLRVMADRTVELVPRGLVTATRTSGDVDGDEAGFQFTVNYGPNTDNAAVALAQMTAGFTLGRAGDNDVCNLCDSNSNLPARIDRTTIDQNTRIDNRPAAVAERDTVPPSITVVRAPAAEVAGVGIADADGWVLGFRILRSNVQGADSPDGVQGLYDPTSYRILGRSRTGNTYTIVPSTVGLTVADGRCTAPLLDLDDCRVMQGRVDIPASQARNIQSFVLGRAPRALRDFSNNDPVVANDDQDPARIVATGSNVGDNALPLNLADSAAFPVIRVRPSFTVRPGQLGRTGTRITGSFDVSGSTIVDEIRNPSSYQLLRVPKPNTGGTTSTISGAITGSGSGDGTRATINFEVDDNTVDLADLYQYTLGRLANLTDKAGAEPVYDAITTGTTIVVGQPLDLRPAAFADIPAVDTFDLIARIEATPATVTADPRNADPSNQFRFSGTFVVNTNKDVPNIENGDAYQLVRVISGGTPDIDATFSFRDDGNTTSTATIGFETTVASIADVQATTGFTLVPTSMFVDVNGATALNNEFLANEDNDPTIAMREQDSPVLSALDQAGTRPTFANGPLVMTPAFRVKENNDDPIRGINQAGSYQLLRLAGSVGSLREVALTAGATIGGSNAGGQLVSVPVTLSNLDELRDTFGFALARMGDNNLTDLSGNAPLGTATDGTAGAEVRTGSRIDLRDTAVWVRESTRPDITVAANGMAQPLSGSAPTVYTGTFRVSSGEVIRNINSPNAYKLLRRTVGGNLSDIEASVTVSSLVGDSTNGYTRADVSFRTTLTTAILRATGNDETAGFTLGNALTDSNGLQDISGNLPVTYTADSLDTRSSAIAARDTTAPTLTVSGQAAMVGTSPIQYTGSFRVSSTEGAIRNLQTPGSYNLAFIARGNQIRQIGATITVSSLVGSVAAGYTAATVNFTADLNESIVTATGNNELRGFILASAPSTGLDGLRDLASNEVTTFRGNNRLLSDGENAANAISEVDREAPVITVVAQATEGEQEQLTYRGTFLVSAPFGNPIRNLNDSAVYRLLRQSIAGDISGITARLDVTTSTVSATPDYYNSATISFATTLTDIVQLEDTAGFTLGENQIGRTGFGGLQDINGNRPNTTPPLRRLDSRNPSLARIEVTENIECAAFYPNIGQNELFFEVISERARGESESAFDQARFTLTQLRASSNPTISTVEQIVTTTEVVILKATLTNEITSDGNITVSYALPGSDNFSVDATCEADLDFDDDTDSDGREDIVDNNPFDPNDDTVNLNVTTTRTAVNTLLSSTFYSREVLVRSLIRGEAFTYVEEGIKKQFTEEMALTPNQYFGINGNDNTQVFVNPSDDCIDVLDFSRTYNLSKVKLDAFCDIGDGMIDFLNQPLGLSMSYMWADIDENGRLIGGNYTDDYSILILAEVNFSGQSSYIYTEETSKTVVVSSYRPVGIPFINVAIKSQSNQGTIFTDERLTIQTAGRLDIVSGTYNAISGERGETITHWLSGDGVDDLWYPTEATLAPREGGYDVENDFAALPSAVGPDSFIDVRVASDGDNEPITRINQILLYDVNTEVPFRVNSMVSNRAYYLVADVTTNRPDVQAVVAAQFMDGYSVISTATTTIGLIQDAGHLIEQEDLAVIALLVEDPTAMGTITVGWDSINSVQNVLATYRVTPTAPSGYRLMDDDNDRIPNIFDLAPTDNTRLQVAVEGNINIETDYLTEHNAGQPLYASDEGLIIAANMGDDSPRDYSVANIDSNTAMLTSLGLDDTETTEAINTIATFGVRSVDYAYTQVSTQTTMAIGGMAHAIFPIPESSTTSEVLYVSHYNAESERWERFERGTSRDGFVDTWYVIDRSGEEPCPTDIQLYKNVHQATGDNEMGFTAEADMPKCVMLAITDGGPYDAGSMGQGLADEQSGADGRINSLIGIGAQLNPSSQGLQCAAIYPNIGQRDLFFEMNKISPDGTFEIAGATIQNVSSVPPAGPEADPVLRVTLGGDITVSMINVKYTIPNGEEFETMCIASLDRDSDRDGVVDIADASPFNIMNRAPNPDTTGQQTTTLAAVDEVTGEYYSRHAVIRSLLREEEFTFIEEVINGEDVGGTFTANMAMDWRAYFGINANANTQIFRIGDDSECGDILEAARDNNLNAVRISEFCDERVTDFSTESVGSQRYVWADVRNGILVASDYPDYNLNIVPEINFSGQPTYIFPEPTTRTVFISAYVGNDRGDTPSVRVRAQSREDAYSEDVTVELTDVSQSGTIRDRYNVAYHNDGHPLPGETIVRWLAATGRIWAPTSATLTVSLGGRDDELNLESIDYAIGTNNNINVRVADPEDEEVTRIRQILLYENATDGPRRVTSVVSGRSYYVVADYDTNRMGGISADNINVNTDLINNYTTPSEVVLSDSAQMVLEGDLNGSYFDIREIIAGSITTTTIITVGWNNIGAIENIREIYLITEEEPSTYETVNARGQLFTAGTMFTAQNSLPVDIEGGLPSDNHILTTHDGQLPVFFTHVGLAIAEDKGGEMGLHYSASNIKYDDISDNTKILLRLGTDDDFIDSIATFGVSDVVYGFNLNEDGQTEVTGGTVYVVFPITIDLSTLIDNTLYVVKHDSSEESPRWRPFERDADAGTWYAIERTDTGVACPTDIQVYINEHEPASGNDGTGFIASEHNCVMLVINDGDNYDASSLDSRVIDPVGFRTRSTADTTPPRTGGGGGGGIGAVGMSDALLLIGVIALLMIATAKRRRKQTITTS